MTFTLVVLLGCCLFLMDGYPVKGGYRISTALLRRRGLYRKRTRRRGRHRA